MLEAPWILIQLVPPARGQARKKRRSSMATGRSLRCSPTWPGGSGLLARRPRGDPRRIGHRLMAATVTLVSGGDPVRVTDATQTPTAALGIPAPSGSRFPIPVLTGELRILAGSGQVVTVCGTR